MEVNTNLVEALENVAQTGFYYPFICRYKELINGVFKDVIGH